MPAPRALVSLYGVTTSLPRPLSSAGDSFEALKAVYPSIFFNEAVVGGAGSAPYPPYSARLENNSLEIMFVIEFGTIVEKRASSLGVRIDVLANGTLAFLDSVVS